VDLVAYDPSAPIRSLAVLPLDNFSGTGEQDYFSAGLHEELIARLSQIGGLRVASRTSVSRYAGADVSVAQIGRDLRVDAVIEGSVQRVGDRARITVQLIHAASDTHVWTQQYDRSLEDVLALQSEVALDIANQIRAELSTEESTFLAQTASRGVDPEAQDAYLRGTFEYAKGTPEGFHAAMGHFEEAVDQDSTFAPALAGLAGTRFLLGMADEEPSQNEMERAAREALRALELDSMSMEAKEVVMLIRDHLPEGIQAEGLGRITVTGRPGPGSPTGTVQVEKLQVLDTVWTATMTHLGRRIEEAVSRQRLAADSEGFGQRAFAVRQLVSSGLYDDAAEMLGSLAEERPTTPGIWPQLARVRVSAGDAEGAVEAMIRWSETGEPEAPSTQEVQALASAVGSSGVKGYWSWTRDRLEEMKAAGRPVPATEYAACLLVEGEADRALDVLEEAVATGDRSLMGLRSDPVWDPVRADPRFAKIARAARSMMLPERPRPPSGGRQRR
jgi:TolB-like protein